MRSTLRTKTRPALRSNQDKDIFSERRYSASADLYKIRVVVFLSV